MSGLCTPVHGCMIYGDGTATRNSTQACPSKFGPPGCKTYLWTSTVFVDSDTGLERQWRRRIRDGNPNFYRFHNKAYAKTDPTDLYYNAVRLVKDEGWEIEKKHDCVLRIF